MKKILFLLTLMAVFVVSCGGGSKNGEAKSDGAPSADVIKVGFLGPLTGENSQYGIATKEGIELRVEEINAAGGIDGKKIELISQDTKGDVSEATSIFKKFVSQDKVDVILGAVLSGESNAIAPMANTEKVLMISPTGTNIDITKGKEYVFRTTFTDPYQGTMAAKYAKKVDLKKVAILVNSSNDYSTGLAAAFKEQAAQDGIEVIEEKYTNSDKDFKTILTKIKNQNPDGIFIPDYYNTVGLIATQAKDLGITTQYLGADGWDGVQKDFSEVTEGAVFASQFAVDDTSPVVQNFIKAYQEKYSKEPIIFAALGYDTVNILEEGIKNSKEISGAGLKDAIKAISLELVTGNLVFDQDNNPSKAVTFVEVKDGKIVLKEKLQ